MSDPFDINTTTTSDSSGVSPDFFQNLMNFGLATMSASSTPGMTLAGALGRGGQAAMENAKNTQQLRMQQQLQQQQMVGAQMGNLQQYSAIQQQNAYNKLQDPTGQYLPQINIPPSISQQFGTPAQGQQPQPQVGNQTGQQGQIPPSGDALTAYRQSQGMQTPPVDTQRAGMGLPVGSATPSPGTSSSGPVWSGSAGYSAPATQTSYPSQGNSSSPMAAMDPAHLARVALGVEKANSPQEIYQAIPFARNPDQRNALIKLYESQTQPQVMRGPVYDPYKGELIQAPEIKETVGEGGRRGYAAVPQGFVRTNINTGESQNIGGIEGSSNQTPQSQPTAQPSAQQPTSNQTTGSPANTNYNPPSFTAELGPGEVKQIDELMQYHSDGEHGELKAYNSSVGSQQNLAQLQSYLKTLNAHQGDANFLQSGSGSQWRTDVAKMANTAWSAMGNDPSSLPFDPNQVSAAEASYKTANLLGMQLINSQFGASKEAASVIQTGLKSVPSMENTPQGAALLLNGAKEVANNTIDRYTFKDWWARPDGPHPGDLRGADVAFNQQFPPQLYAKRAISQDKPIDISGLKQPPNLLPGTVIKYGNASPKVWQPNVKYPFQLPSINGTQNGQ